MCGITLTSVNYKPLASLSHRGQTSTKTIQTANGKYNLIFDRLAINDLSENGDQPFINENVYMMCNGEIYNHIELEKKYNIRTRSKSDCEIILHLYHLMGFKEMIELLDGEFAIILYDENKDILYAARDPLGVRPLFYNLAVNGFASEAKVLPNDIFTLPFKAGNIYDSQSNELSEYLSVRQFPSINLDEYDEDQLKEYQKNIRELFMRAVNKRINNSERPIGLLLSGGFDSSLVASMVRTLRPHDELHTFSIGQDDSSDLKYARIMAKYINSTHHEIKYNGHDVIKRMPELIRRLETYDITTIRASMPMYLLSEYIAKNTDVKVILSGEGSDEFGYYKYFENAPSILEACKESRRLFEDIYYYDVLRADRSTASYSLELRVPFLDLDFFRYMHTIPYKFHRPNKGYNGEMIEKCNLREAFLGYLPEEVLWRKKDAFSDSVGLSWREMLIAYAEKNIDENDFNKYTFCKNPPKTKEALWYRLLYNEYYKDNLIPYYWMPKWTKKEVNDPSAKIL
jgi:asparagine synthase (glutamine-hydrolysing)